MPEVTVKLTPKQTQAFRLLTSPESLALLYGGAKGGAKSFLLCVWLKAWIISLISLFSLKPTPYPIPLGFVGRKRAKDFKDTTLEDFKRIIPTDHYKFHDDENEIIFYDRVKVFCGGLDDRKKIEKFNSANFAFFIIEQAEETEREDISVLKATLRLRLNNITPPYKELYTANPGDCWLKTDFIDTKLPHHYFIPALYTDNPHLPANYRETLENAFRYNPVLLKAYRDGDWTAIQASNQLITEVMLSNLKGITIWPKYMRRILTCDPSTGGDECVIYVIENGKVVDELMLHERDTMKIAGEIIIMSNKHNVRSFVIDTIGIGQGIYDRLRELLRNANIFSLNSAEEARDPDRFSNVRAEMWWKTMAQIQDRLIPYPEDEELRRQLTAPRFKVVNSNGKILMEPKDETKKRLGRSPDRADAFVMAIYRLPDTEPVVEKDAWREEGEPMGVRGGAMSAMTA